MGTKKPELVFVYNADSGLFNGAMDFVHKKLSPQTYNCNLCAVTYGNLGMKKQWQQYIEGLPIKSQFLHRDEFAEQVTKLDVDLPVILIREKGRLYTLVSAKELNEISDLNELITSVNAKLEKYLR
jgi:hypothetical protein